MDLSASFESNVKGALILILGFTIAGGFALAWFGKLPFIDRKPSSGEATLVEGTS